MTDKELDEATHIVEDLLQNYGGDRDKGEFNAINKVIKAARELQSLKNGTHPDMVLMPRDTYDAKKHESCYP